MAPKCTQLLAVVALAAIGTIGQSSAGSLKIIYAFQGKSDGANPEVPLINIDGTLYGATYGGGGTQKHCLGGCGTIFSITPEGVEKVLYRFQGLSDGEFPFGLMQVDKSIVGVSTYSNAYNIFSVTTGGKFSVLGLAETPQWAMNRRPITEDGDTGFGADFGTSYSDCANGACGYIYAIKP